MGSNNGCNELELSLWRCSHSRHHWFSAIVCGFSAAASPLPLSGDMFLGNAQDMERFVASAVCALAALGCVVFPRQSKLMWPHVNRLLLFCVTYHVAAVWRFGLFIGQSSRTGWLSDWLIDLNFVCFWSDWSDEWFLDLSRAYPFLPFC